MYFTREYQLAAACARWPPSPGRAAAIRKGVNGAIDWDEFLRIARRHRVSGLANHGLADQAGVPPKIRAHLRSEAIAWAGVNLLMAAETARLHRLFAASDVLPVFLKGVTLAVVAYGDVSLRHSKDIDILVAPEHVSRSSEILVSAGYQRALPPPDLGESHLRAWLREFHHGVFVNADLGIEVELHWRLFRNRNFVPRLQSALEQSVVALPDGTEVRTLARQDLFAYLCAHGALEEWFRLKWLADVGALLAQGSPPRPEDLYDAAARRGAGVFAAQAILLSHRVFDVPLPRSVSKRLATRRTLRLEARALRAISDPHFQAEPCGWPLRARIQTQVDALTLGGWRYFAAQLRVLLFSAADMRLVRLPEEGTFLYPVIRGPLWLWRRIRRVA